MKSFHLEILSPERNFYTGECISLVVPISDGMLGIMAGRTPLTAAISDGEVIFTGTEEECSERIENDTTGLLEMYPESGRCD